MSQKAHIIDRAMRMFVDQGIKAVRMDDIARELGVSKRTLYELFGDKDELLFLCFKQYLEEIERRVRERALAFSSNKLEEIMIGLSEVMQYSETNTRIMGNLRKFYPEVCERIHKEHGEKGSERLRTAIHGVVELGWIDRNANIDLALTMLYYMAFGIVTRKDMILPEGLSAHAAFTHVVVLFFRGISTPEGMRIIDEMQQSERFRHYIED